MSLYYNAQLHAYVDRETNAIVVPLEPGDIVPELNYRASPQPSPLPQPSHSTNYFLSNTAKVSM